MVDGRRALPLVAVGFLLGACGGSVDEDADLVPALVAEETLRIGSVDDPETSLTQFFALEVDSEGRIYTVHPFDAEVRIHGPDGTPLGTFGGRGDGPGEFQSPTSLGFADGEIWVVDSRAGRVTYFSPTGEFLRDDTYRPQTPDDPSDLIPSPRGRLPDGTLYGSPGLPAHLISTGEITHQATVRMRLDGEVIDTIALRRLGRMQMTIPLGRGAMYATQPFSDAPIVIVSGKTGLGLAIDRETDAASTSFRATKWSMPADTQWSREIAFKPVTLPASAVDSFVTYFAGMMAERGTMARGEAEDAVRGELFVPPHLPPVGRALIGRDGSVWLQKSDRTSGTDRWLILESDGRPYGELTLPERVTPINVRLDRLWGRALDDLDVSYIVRYAVRPAELLEGGS